MLAVAISAFGLQIVRVGSWSGLATQSWQFVGVGDWRWQFEGWHFRFGNSYETGNWYVLAELLPNVNCIAKRMPVSRNRPANLYQY